MKWQKIEDAISKATGKTFRSDRPSSVGGGCINAAYHLQGEQQDYFVKLNSADRLDMFEAEAAGLQELANANALKIPAPVCTGVVDNQCFIVMQYIPFGGRGDASIMATFGEQLAQLHRYTQKQYGWFRDNTIGSTHQPNHYEDDWLIFWRKHRLGFQLELACRHGLGAGAQSKGEKLLAQLEEFFDGYQPEASLLHGDLWSGNYAISSEGEPVIFDPAVYFGDREADLAMTELFGSFGREFYAAYQNSWPLDEGYTVRKTLYNLYHILNHYNLFGGGYGSQAMGMMDRLLAEIR
jgi:protein-ribulosamine 3-kinase